jgi:hypothetical protein
VLSPTFTHTILRLSPVVGRKEERVVEAGRVAVKASVASWSTVLIPVILAAVYVAVPAEEVAKGEERRFPPSKVTAPVIPAVEVTVKVVPRTSPSDGEVLSALMPLGNRVPEPSCGWSLLPTTNPTTPPKMRATIAVTRIFLFIVVDD